jgi:hypothetical protein
MNRRLRLASYVSAVSLTLIACGAPIDIGAASAAGSKFHDRFNHQDYSAIYAAADSKFRAAVKPDDLTALLARIHDKLGTSSTPLASALT